MENQQLLFQDILNKLDRLDSNLKDVVETVNCTKVTVERLNGRVYLIQQQGCPKDPVSIKGIIEHALLNRDIKKPAKRREILLWIVVFFQGIFTLYITFTKLL